MGHTKKFRDSASRIAHLRRLQRGDQIERRKHRRDQLRREQAEAEAYERFCTGEQWRTTTVPLPEGLRVTEAVQVCGHFNADGELVITARRASRFVGAE